MMEKLLILTLKALTIALKNGLLLKITGIILKAIFHTSPPQDTLAVSHDAAISFGSKIGAAFKTVKAAVVKEAKHKWRVHSETEQAVAIIRRQQKEALDDFATMDGYRIKATKQELALHKVKQEKNKLELQIAWRGLSPDAKKRIKDRGNIDPSFYEGLDND